MASNLNQTSIISFAATTEAVAFYDVKMKLDESYFWKIKFQNDNYMVKKICSDIFKKSK